jgi:hypothetical protein
MRAAYLSTLVLCALGLVIGTVSAQADASVPFLWEEGELALAYPAVWDVPVSERTAVGARLVMTASSAAPAPTIVVERVFPPIIRPFDLLAGRLAAEGVRVGAPSQSVLAGLAAVEVLSAEMGQNAGIGRGTILVDGSALIVYGYAANTESAELRFHYDGVVESLVLGAWQMPRIPREGGYYARAGSERLSLEQAGLGRLDLTTESQMWSYAGVEGEMISVFASDINRLETFNLRLRITAPDGRVLAENDNHDGRSFYGLFSLYDAAVRDVRLPVDGIYAIIVDAIFGEGVYAIGVRQTHSIAFESGGVTRISGRIDDVFSAESWTFIGRAGQVFTITMLAAEDTTLDPALRLIGPSGQIVEQNDDARDPSLGFNSQLVQVQLQSDGLYRLDATRYAGAGEGAYEIVIVATS